MVNAILPCLHEASALPQVLSGPPAAYWAIVADDGSVVEAGTADIVCILDAGGSFDLCLDAVDGNRAHTRVLVIDRRFEFSPRWTQLPQAAVGLDNREDGR